MLPAPYNLATMRLEMIQMINVRDPDPGPIVRHDLVYNLIPMTFGFSRNPTTNPFITTGFSISSGRGAGFTSGRYANIWIRLRISDLWHEEGNDRTFTQFAVPPSDWFQATFAS